MSYKNVLVIGASRGIGLEWAKQLSQKTSANLFLTCRQNNEHLENLTKSSPNIKLIENIDVANDSMVKNLQNHEILKNVDQLDLCIHNSGIMQPDNISDFNLEQHKHIYDVNALGPLRTIQAIEPKLEKNSKFIIMSAILGSIETANNFYPGVYGYKMSKAAVNMAGKTLAKDLRKKKVVVGMLHPGYVATDLNKFKGMMSTEKSVEKMLKLIEKMDMKASGSFLDYSGKTIPL